MDNFFSIILILVYSFFAIRWGLKYIDGRWAWLEQPHLKVLKIIISIVWGYIFVAFYFIAWCFKIFESLFR